MVQTVVIKRAFERRNASEDQSTAREFFYERLMQVVVHHEYYNENDKLCPDLLIEPTAETQQLMARIGLLFRREPHGFSVLFNTAKGRPEALLNFLARPTFEVPDEGDDEHHGWWKRLSFTAAPTKDTFINYTGLPLDTKPLETNFYLSNYHGRNIPLEPLTPALRRTPRVGLKDGGPLSRGPYVSPADALPVVPAKFPLRYLPGVEEFVVLGLSGAELQCYPRCLDPEAVKQKGLDGTSCADALPASQGGSCREVAFINLTPLPLDRYTLTFHDSNRATKDPTIRTPLEVLYTTAHPTPLCFIDLLFARPTLESPGTYPVERWPTPHIKDGVRYDLNFRNRSTQWRYFVVPRGGEILEYRDLEIISHGTPVGFAPGVRHDLPNGQQALRFDSLENLPLLQRYSFHFSLEGTQSQFDERRTLLAKLPTPSPLQVGPPPSRRPDDQRAKTKLFSRAHPDGIALRPENTSDIYVYF